MAKNIKTKVRDWAVIEGYDAALIKLSRKGVSISLGQKLLAGTYHHELSREKEEAIKKAMAS